MDHGSFEGKYQNTEVVRTIKIMATGERERDGVCEPIGIEIETDQNARPSEHRAGITTGPNSPIDICVRVVSWMHIRWRLE